VTPSDPDDRDERARLREEAAELGPPTDDLAPVSRRALTLPDTSTVSALVWGTVPGRAAFVHGGGLDAHTWNATIMAAGWDAVAVDLPGHGDWSWFDDAEYRPERIAGPVALALDEWAPAADVVVGQSLGGLAAIALAPPGRTSCVASWSSMSAPGSSSWRTRATRSGTSSPAARTSARATRSSSGSSPSASGRAVPPSSGALLRNTRVRDDGRVVFEHHLANLDGKRPTFTADLGTLWPALAAIEAPVLLIRRTRGFLTDELADELVARARHGRALRIDRGHNVQEEAPVALAAAIGTFLAESAP
jgi:pimeloyl-ACP methyl ester carboxylesterase